MEAINSKTGVVSLLPVELATKIYCLLPSFSDVFALAATCRRLRRIWVVNFIPIYNEIKPRATSFERHMREFHTDQGGSSTDLSTLAFDDVLDMVRSSYVVARTTLQCERQLIRAFGGTVCIIGKSEITRILLTFQKPLGAGSTNNRHQRRRSAQAHAGTNTN